MRGLVIGLGALAVACGAAPEVRPLKPGGLDWVGGAWSSVCLEGEHLRAVRDGELAAWRLTPAGPVPEDPSPVPAATCLPAGQATLPDGRRVVWGPSGLFLGEADGPLHWWRPAAGRLVAATWDGEVVRAVGPDGLWHWRPGTVAPVPSPLPAELQDIEITRIFRDGPLIWVADGRVGAPLEVRGPVPVLVAPLAPLPPDDPTLQTLLGGEVVTARRGVAGLNFGGRPVPTSGPVFALLPHDDLLFVATDKALLAYDHPDNPPLIVGELEAPAIALFSAAPNRILVVSTRQGFGQLTVTR